MEALAEFPAWIANGFLEMAKEGAAFLSVALPNPDLLKPMDPDRIAAASRAASAAMEEFSKYPSSGKVSWSAVCIPSKEWAKKVFPDIDEEAGVEALWDRIFSVTRVNADNPVEAWKEHTANLRRRLDYLNAKSYKKLHYKSSVTDITLELPEEHIWVGGGINDEKGTYFVPNIPTEEIFTMPLKEGVNGTVKSTMPLNVRGKVINSFTLTFEKGRIVDFTAENEYETLKKLIETDDGSHYIGEVALVPVDSPISNSKVTFYNTLFDENASCHFAIGMAYPLCIKGGGTMNKEELEKNGANTSLNHVDFMMGSVDLDIDGYTADGSVEPIFRNGNWAF
jgi:aminopeptidase